MSTSKTGVYSVWRHCVHKVGDIKDAKGIYPRCGKRFKTKVQHQNFMGLIIPTIIGSMYCKDHRVK